MEAKKFFIIDFDSTFTQVEALDVLGEISLANHPEKRERLQKIKDITDKGMDGGMSFRESLERRLELLNAHKNHLDELVQKLSHKVSESFKRNREFFETNSERIFILSNGFTEFITPIVTEYGIKPENVYANQFTYDDQGNIDGFDKDNILSSVFDFLNVTPKPVQEKTLKHTSDNLRDVVLNFDQ